MKTSLVLVPIGLALGLLPLACTSGDDGASSRSDDQTVHPSGNDLPGKLVVTAPSAPGFEIEKTTFRMNNMDPVDLRQELGPVPVGAQTVRMDTQGQFAAFSSSATATILSSQMTTVTTGLLGVKATGGPRTLGLAQLPTNWGIHLANEGSGSGFLNATSDGSRLLPLFEGRYEVNYGLDAIDGVPVTMISGAMQVIAAYDTANRRVTRLKAPARDLPDAECGNGGHKWILSVANSSAFQEVTVESGDELDVGISPRHEGSSYTLRASAWRSNVAIPLGDRGMGPKKWELGRIDVDDVSINGSATKVKGTYAIFAADPTTGAASGPNFVTCAPKTGSGVDVPPGHYRVETTYHTVEAGDKTDVQVIDVP